MLDNDDTSDPATDPVSDPATDPSTDLVTDDFGDPGRFGKNVMPTEDCFGSLEFSDNSFSDSAFNESRSNLISCGIENTDSDFFEADFFEAALLGTNTGSKVAAEAVSAGPVAEAFAKGLKLGSK